MKLTLKDGLECNYWSMAADEQYHRAKFALYLWALGCFRYPASMLEIGTGPYSGFLGLLPHVARRVGVDPLYDLYRETNTFRQFEGVEYVTEHFEDWQSTETFDAIFAVDALDHGDMGFHLLPKIAGMLNPGGRFYLIVHLRPVARLNEIHDHQMTEADLDKALAGLDLTELRRDRYPQELDGTFDCPCLVGVWEKR